MLRQLLEILHAAFFIIATLICPAGFLVGVIGSVVAAIVRLNIKRKILKSGKVQLE